MWILHKLFRCYNNVITLPVCMQFIHFFLFFSDLFQASLWVHVVDNAGVCRIVYFWWSQWYPLHYSKVSIEDIS